MVNQPPALSVPKHSTHEPESRPSSKSLTELGRVIDAIAASNTLATNRHIAKALKIDCDVMLQTLEDRKAKLEACVEIEKQFRATGWGASTRKVSFKKSKDDLATADAPLWWACNIPMPRLATCGQKYSNLYSSFTPAPSAEALRCLEQYKGTFDRFQLWWIPIHFNVSYSSTASVYESHPAKLEHYPAILIGVKDIGQGDHMYFEIASWEQEIDDKDWWSLEKAD